ncbi:hypothetical protein [Mycoplasma todarodis]|uniref:hypothetical protein n=1 Tax=Mycoplasma todarodis TaxID=1937191 RepID=UPI003AB26C61
MKLHELKSTEGSRKLRTRKGRGHAAGKGKTADKTKDQVEEYVQDLKGDKTHDSDVYLNVDLQTLTTLNTKQLTFQH